ncbi:MAG: flagellar protein FlaG [Peptococcaceae bacterium]|jgi:uncharacterized FlaG/YvyC family protein|nr:flagellar protein FlaG [Peptococcaceae bacterium]
MKIDSITGSPYPRFPYAGEQTRGLPGRKGAVEPGSVSQLPLQPENNSNKDTSPHNLDEAVEQANRTFETYGTQLRFSLHEASGEMMVQVINTKDDSVIREIPPERVLDFVADVKRMLGIIIDKFI